MINSSFRSHTRLRPWSVSAISAATLVVAGMSVFGAPAAGAATTAGSGGPFSVRVASSGLAININDPSLPIQEETEAGPYAASAVLDSLGASQAVAGAPSLGDFVGPLVGTLNGLGSGQAPSIPPVPGEVRSSFPGQPAAVQRNAGFSVEAASAERESKAAVNLGSMAPGAENANLFSLAHALADRSGALTAVGSAGADLLNIGGVLDIGRVASSITMNRSALGASKFVTTTDVGTITISGQKFGLDQDGLKVAGTNAGSSGQQVNEAAQALQQAGIALRFVPSTVTFVPGTRTVESLRSGVVEVSVQQEVPSQGLVTITYTLGQVELSATGSRGTSDVVGVSDHRVVGGHTSFAQASDSDGSVAIITPTLKFLRFGSVVGMPNGCNIFFGVLGSGATEAGVAGDSGSALAPGVEGCNALGVAGGEQLTGLMPTVEPLAAINPLVDPGIDSFGDGLETIGRDHAEAVAPFGPTIAGSAESARFFKGCEEC